MGEQHRRGLEVVVGEEGPEAVLDTHAGVDDQALLAAAGGQDVAVGLERGRREAQEKHVMERIQRGAELPARVCESVTWCGRSA